MYKVFDTLEQYNAYTENGTKLTSGVIYLVKDTKALFFRTNNLSGEQETYDYLDEIPEGYIIPTGNKTITENGENIDVNDYATATVNVDAPAKDYIVEGREYDPTETYSGEFVSSNYIATANIPSGFTSIGNSAFNNCSGLTSVTIPDSVTSIGGYVFYGCTSLTSITIPDGVTSIGTQAFNKCSVLTSITIPSGVTSIGYSAFNSCSSLTSVRILATTPPTLGTNAFAGNASGRKIYVPAASVETYKTATNWSAYAADIEAIPTA